MSTQQKGITCALCHAYLFEEDDTVYCPVCGAPHHRACYNSIGHCALEELHGTEKEYKKPVIEEQSEQEQPQQTKRVVFTNAEEPFSAYPHIDFLGGVKPDYEFAKGVTAKETANFVLSNTMRYIPKFARLNKKNKISFNFLAFLFPSGWFLSRKMYKSGIVAGALTVIAALFSIPLEKTLFNLGILQSASYYEMFEKLSNHIGEISVAVVFASFIGGILNLAIKLVCALLGDYWYKEHTIKTIKEIKKSSYDKAFDFRKKGGVNIFLFFIGVFAVQYIPMIISTFI